MMFREEDGSEPLDGAILFASYEARSTRVASELAARGFEGQVHVLYCEDIECKQTAEHLATVEQLLGPDVEQVPVSYHSPAAVIKATREIDFTGRTLIDVSCFNRGNLFPFLWASRLGQGVVSKVTFAYSAPEKYGDWLSRDYSPASNIIGYAGGLGFARGRLLVCVVGYESQRALAVIQAAEPSRVVLAVGGIPTREEFMLRNREAVRIVLGSENYEVCDIDVSDPQGSMRDLKAIVDREQAGTTVSIAPFSTKLSCLGVWGLWLGCQSIRVWNAQPATYNVLDYSKGAMPPRYFGVEWD